MATQKRDVAMLLEIRDIIFNLSREMRLRRQSIAATAEQMGIDTAYLYRIINGERVPSMDTLSKWAELYDKKLRCTMCLFDDLPEERQSEPILYRIKRH